MERWQKPIVPRNVEDNLEILYYTPSGKKAAKPTWGLSPDDFERLKRGEGCMRCLCVWEVPWPERCPDCGYQVRDKQARDLHLEFKGERWLGPVRALEMWKNREPITDPKGYVSGADLAVPKQGLLVPKSDKSAGGVVLPPGGKDA